MHKACILAQRTYAPALLPGVAALALPAHEQSTPTHRGEACEVGSVPGAHRAAAALPLKRLQPPHLLLTLGPDRLPQPLQEGGDCLGAVGQRHTVQLQAGRGSVGPVRLLSCRLLMSGIYAVQATIMCLACSSLAQPPFLGLLQHGLCRQAQRALYFPHTTLPLRDSLL